MFVIFLSLFLIFDYCFFPLSFLFAFLLLGFFSPSHLLPATSQSSENEKKNPLKNWSQKTNAEKGHAKFKTCLL